MKREDIMRQAIATALAAKTEGGVAIGAVLVDKAGSIIATGQSIVGLTKDPTSHAEINCIRTASGRLGTDDLYGYSLYCTLEPCSMCLGAAAWARIQHIYFGAYRKDVDPSLFDTDSPNDEKAAAHMNLRGRHHMHIEGGILETDCAQLLAGYHDKARH